MINNLLAVKVLKPEMLKGPDDQVITENEDGSFTASVTGKPLPKVQW